MIIIIGTSNDDLTTDLVIDWLDSYKCMFVKVTPIAIVFDDLIHIENSKVFIKGIEIDSNDVFWYRRWSPQNEIHRYLKNRVKIPEVREKLLTFLSSEVNNIGNFIFNFYKEFKWLSKASDESINKLIQVSVAKEVGLNVPDTYFSSDVSLISRLDKPMITKSIDSQISISIDGAVFHPYTVEIKNISADKIFPSLIQEKINKQFEIRTFYLDGKIYSAAIFSQQDKQTEIDYRRYNSSNPNRVVPYLLDKVTEKKVKNLMFKLNMNSGSIDFIFSDKGKIIFLEVNPVGQFGMISKPCNYFLEKEVATYLKKQQDE